MSVIFESLSARQQQYDVKGCLGKDIIPALPNKQCLPSMCSEGAPKEYLEVKTQLGSYRELLVHHLQMQRSLDNKTIQKIGQFINSRLEWFYLSSKKTTLLKDQESHELINALTEMRRVICEMQSASITPKSSLAPKLAAQITRILPKERVPEDVLPNIYKYLSVSNPEDIQASLEIIRNQILVNERGWELLAAWISYHKVALEEVHLTEKELYAIAPFLTHVTIGNAPAWDRVGEVALWDNQKYHHFLGKCTKLTSLSIFTNRITHLPEMAKQLLHLVCFNCSKLMELPANMHALKTLECSDCPALTGLPVGMRSLRKLECSNCPLLSGLPEDMSSLQQLECKHCPELASLPVMPALQALSCYHCLKLATFAAVMSTLKELHLKNCPMLISLPTMPALQMLSCKQCIRLVALAAGAQALRTLDCQKCPALKSLPTDMKALRSLYYKHCPLNISAELKTQLCVINNKCGPFI